MVGKECDKQPSKATVLNMNLLRLHFSLQHVGEVFATEKDSCLLTEETSRKGAKYMGYEASDIVLFHVMLLRVNSSSKASHTMHTMGLTNVFRGELGKTRSLSQK